MAAGAVQGQKPLVNGPQAARVVHMGTYRALVCLGTAAGHEIVTNVRALSKVENSDV